MTHETMRVERDGSLGLITLDRQASHNALCEQTFVELLDVLGRWKQDDNVHTVILTGAGEAAFAAGADIKEMYSRQSTESFLNFERLILEAVTALEQFPYPVIAAINGVALGGGTELALACDLRVAAEGARLGLPEVSLGLIPGGGGTQRLPRLIGMAAAREIIYTGRQIGAEEALSLGLVNYVVPADCLLLKARSIAEVILTQSPLALQMAKRATALAWSRPLREGLQQELELCVRLWDTEDRRERMAAFVEKRRPAFQGN